MADRGIPPEPPPGARFMSGQAAFPPPITVSQLAAQIRQAVVVGVPPRVRVIGEVSNVHLRTHCYFDLKDAGALIGCVLFAGTLRRVRPPVSGQQVVVAGRVEFYRPQGRISLVVDGIEPVGAGALEQKFRQLCEELRALGWFDDSRKRALPAFPRRVAVITSLAGAAVRDVLDTMRRRCPAVAVALLDVRVQGDGAADEIARAIRWVRRHHRRLGIDVVLVTRGGGSLEDLWAFNERVVAEAIVYSPVPVIAAIGHESDTTIAELVADVRAATPTQAAMRLTPDRAALTEQMALLESRLDVRMRQTIAAARRRVEQAGARRALTDPFHPVREARLRLESRRRVLLALAQAMIRHAGEQYARAAGRLAACCPAELFTRRCSALAVASVRLPDALRHRQARAYLAMAHKIPQLVRAWHTRGQREAVRLEHLGRQLDIVGPVSVLRRGYSCTMRADGRLVRSVGDVAPGDRLRTRVADGEIRSLVEGDADHGQRHRAAGDASGRDRPPGAVDLFSDIR